MFTELLYTVVALNKKQMNDYSVVQLSTLSHHCLLEMVLKIQWKTNRPHMSMVFSRDRSLFGFEVFFSSSSFS